MLNRKTDKNLVPKQENEVKEGNPGDKGIKRTGETGAGAEGGGGGSGGCCRGTKLVVNFCRVIRNLNLKGKPLIFFFF